jgi:hypothetical protein
MKAIIRLIVSGLAIQVAFTVLSSCGSGAGTVISKIGEEKPAGNNPGVSAGNFISEDGKFKVCFGGKPTVSAQKVPTEVGDIEVHMFIYEKSATEIYLVGYSDYPSELISQSNQSEVIKGAQTGVVSELKAKITEEKNVRVAGNDGIWFRANSDQYFITYKLFLSKNRLYQLGMVRDGSHVTDLAVRGFMDTFELVQ